MAESFHPSNNIDVMSATLTDITTAIAAAQAREAENVKYIDTTSVDLLRVIANRFAKGEISYEQMAEESKVVADDRECYRQVLLSIRANIASLSARKDALTKLRDANINVQKYASAIQSKAAECKSAIVSYALARAQHKDALSMFLANEQSMCPIDTSQDEKVRTLHSIVRELCGIEKKEAPKSTSAPASASASAPTPVATPAHGCHSHVHADAKMVGSTLVINIGNTPEYCKNLRCSRLQPHSC
jgi:hypothetical protein